MSRAISLHRALHDPALLGAGLGDLSTWGVWVSVLKAAYGEPLTDEERAAFASVSGGREPPTRKVKQMAAVVSRRAGKGRAAGALAVYESCLLSHRKHLARGEVGCTAIISPTKSQSRICFDYCMGYLEASPILRNEIADYTQDEIRLKNGNLITTLSSDYRSLRGRTLLLAILDEASFLRDETSATPDVECARALLPGLMTTGGILVTLSSPYRRQGLVFQLHRDFFSKDSDEVLVVAGASRDFNPTLDAELIEAARAADPEAAASEWFGSWRSDASAFLDEATIESATDRSRPLELPPRAGVSYFAFVDASAGRHDAFTVCVCHQLGGQVVADVIRGCKPPFDPQSVANHWADLAKEYGCRQVTGDNYAGEWVAGAFRNAGLDYVRSELAASELFIEGLPIFTRGLASIPAHTDLLRELRLLERRVARSGKDRVEHGPGGTDDYANALFGAMVLVSRHQPFVVTSELLMRVAMMEPNRHRSATAWGWQKRAQTMQMAHHLIPQEKRTYPAWALSADKFINPSEPSEGD
jgi:hypothetical protein